MDDGDDSEAAIALTAIQSVHFENPCHQESPAIIPALLFFGFAARVTIALRFRTIGCCWLGDKGGTPFSCRRNHSMAVKKIRLERRDPNCKFFQKSERLNDQGRGHRPTIEQFGSQ
jgi:hypothetical protein